MIYGTHNVPLAVNAVLKRPNIGVAVIELPADSQETIETLNLLKQNKPELISIVLTEQPDAQVAVDLINSGQVFRYLSKPLDSQGLQKAIGQAFKRHLSLRANQPLRKRYRVSQPSRIAQSGIASLFKNHNNHSLA